MIGRFCILSYDGLNIFFLLRARLHPRRLLVRSATTVVVEISLVLMEEHVGKTVKRLGSDSSVTVLQGLLANCVKVIIVTTITILLVNSTTTITTVLFFNSTTTTTTTTIILLFSSSSFSILLFSSSSSSSILFFSTSSCTTNTMGTFKGTGKDSQFPLLCL